ncbi:bacillithiol biosynthesis deacetylase BshB2 [Paenibacillus glycinis]|uniref:Bacillithiol biosynthesis deacetylase BshB2 n=1 Tax=Paenibacillus glycinis TaxID=2697035 RepID=A0ABW9XSM1_9BACL|nr:bacillithiol biosynthesis deacetylase BshB2 [Paenibacillus glycinis]NBD25670.1 bacillithiol biosynthesis deacetylase BshB2 [Paenibacillus glycinis]
MERHILVVLPHPDDEAFSLSGTLAKHIEAGSPVTYACLTLGEMGRNMGNPPFTNRVELPGIRKQELEESCAAIGIQDLRLLGYHDKTVEFEDTALLDGNIAAILDEVKPSLVYTFYPGYSVHPDHDATGAAVVRTVGRLPEDERPTVRCMAFSRDHELAIGRPDVISDVKGFLKQKMGAIRAHRSQFHGVIGSNSLTDREMQERFGTERFWTYRFN